MCGCRHGWWVSGCREDWRFGHAVLSRAPTAPTNLTLHEAQDINVPIGCGDAAVFPGDVIMGDSDGVIVLPAHLADEITEECSGMEDFETFVLENVLAGHSVIGLYPPTQQETEDRYAAWLRAQKLAGFTALTM